MGSLCRSSFWWDAVRLLILCVLKYLTGTVWNGRDPHQNPEFPQVKGKQGSWELGWTRSRQESWFETCFLSQQSTAWVIIYSLCCMWSWLPEVYFMFPVHNNNWINNCLLLESACSTGRAVQTTGTLSLSHRPPEPHVPLQLQAPVSPHAPHYTCFSLHISHLACVSVAVGWESGGTALSGRSDSFINPSPALATSLPALKTKTSTHLSLAATRSLQQGAQQKLQQRAGDSSSCWYTVLGVGGGECKASAFSDSYVTDL